jgi:2-oxo-4-hydroxy-4-carboxy--5-ureidoimidazoline (OHCU) decarboxylase
MAASTVQDSALKPLLERMVASRQLSSLDADALLRAHPQLSGEEAILRWLAAEYGLGYTTLEDAYKRY